MSFVSDDSRYLIYWLLQQKVEVQAHTGKRVAGKVERVYRDVMDGKVEFTVGGKHMSFVEPDTIMMDGNDLVFVYGSMVSKEETDEDVFREARLASVSGESLTEVLQRTAPCIRRETRFSVQPEMQAVPA